MNGGCAHARALIKEIDNLKDDISAKELVLINIERNDDFDSADPNYQRYQQIKFLLLDILFSKRAQLSQECHCCMSSLPPAPSVATVAAIAPLPHVVIDVTNETDVVGNRVATNRHPQNINSDASINCTSSSKKQGFISHFTMELPPGALLPAKEIRLYQDAKAMVARIIDKLHKKQCHFISPDGLLITRVEYDMIWNRILMHGSDQHISDCISCQLHQFITMVDKKHGVIHFSNVYIPEFVDI